MNTRLSNKYIQRIRKYLYFKGKVYCLALLLIPIFSNAQPRTRLSSDSPTYASLTIDSVNYDWQVQDTEQTFNTSDE